MMRLNDACKFYFQRLRFHGDEVGRLRAEGAVPHDLTCTVVLSDYGERHVELRVVSLA